MMFLNTDGTMKLEEHDELCSTCYIELEDHMLDLNVSDFCCLINEKVHHYNYAKDTPVNFIIKCDGISTEDITYCKDMILEFLTEAIRKEKVNKNWQPSVALSNSLNMTILAQTNLLNYRTEPNILNVIFVKNDEEIDAMIKKS